MVATTESNSKNKSLDHFPLLFTFFRLAGLPLEMKQFFIFQRIYNLIISLCSYSTYVGIIAHAFSPPEDNRTITELLTSIRLANLMALYIWTEINIRIKSKAVGDLFLQIDNFTWEEIPKIDIVSGELTIGGIMKRIETFIKIIMNGTVGLYVLQTTVKTFTSRELMFPASYPFDVSVSPIYEFLLLTQILAFLRIVGIFYGTPYLYSILVCVGCTQLQKIKIMILRIKQNKGNHTYSEEETFRIQNELSFCIKLHQQVLRYLNDIEDATSIMLAGIFFLLLLESCTAAFAAIADLGDIGNLSECITFYVSVMSVTSIYCLFATKLYQEYDEVRNAAWSSDWIGAPISYQRSIALIITMANKEFTLTAGKAVPVSNSTLLSMINESMSLFMFLLAMRDKSQQ